MLNGVAAVGPPELSVLHADELPQKDNLCGCFWGSLVLRANGVDADQDLVAQEAGTLLPEGDPATFVPRGETPRNDYRLPLPLTENADESGTSASGLALAVERLADGRLLAIPVSGPWTADAVCDLVESVANSAPTTALIANLRTGHLWGSRPEPALLVRTLLEGGATLAAPAADWDVGHFVNIAAALRGPGGVLLLVRDSYRSLGWNAHHLQPPAAIAAGLRRGDGWEGGVLCITPAADNGRLSETLAGDGFNLSHWNNGTPSP